MTLTAPAPASIPAAFELRRVESRRDWSEVRSLRDRALARRHDLPDDVEGLADDGYDAALNTVTFLLTRDGRNAGCTRSSVSSAARRFPLPAMETFPREIEEAVGREATLVESSLTFLDPDLSGDTREALFRLFKGQMLRCASEEAHWLIAAVPEAQVGFHRRMFNMEILSGSEPCPGFVLPRVLMGLDFRRQASVLFRRIPALAVEMPR